MPGKFPPEAIVGRQAVKGGGVEFKVKWFNCSQVIQMKLITLRKSGKLRMTRSHRKRCDEMADSERQRTKSLSQILTETKMSLTSTKMIT